MAAVGGLLSFAAGAGMIYADCGRRHSESGDLASSLCFWGGPVMVRISARQVRYQRGAFEDWLAARVGIRPVCPLCRA